MNPNRHRLVWFAFSLCVALAAAAMIGVDTTARRLERTEAQTRALVDREESVQVALWRMDSALAELVAEEGTRPYFHYRPFYSVEREHGRLESEIDRGDVLIPSPLLRFGSPRVRLHFQIDPNGKFTSPQVPSEDHGRTDPPREPTSTDVHEPSRRLEELEKIVRPEDLLAALEDRVSVFCCPTDVLCCPNDEPIVVSQSPPALLQKWDQESRGLNNYQKRSTITRSAQAPQAVAGYATPSKTGRVTQGRIRAVWMGPALLLARRVKVEDKLYVQGCWLDWDRIRAELLAGVSDLVPAGDLRPVRAPGLASPTHCLTAIPAQLVATVAPAEVLSGRSPVSLSLAIAWGGLGLSSVAVALLLGGVLALSERREQFVSAVTHELRTPLTTFRLYTEMLADGMVPNEQTRQTYLQTLRAEADRLGHLVENVLAYARVERGRAADRREVVEIDLLLDRLIPSLSDQAKRAGMELVLEKTTVHDCVRTDASAVAQILANLVDNACKYASSSTDRRFHLQTSVDGANLALAFRDHGPGVSRREARRLFRPFSKSASEAARSAPGVGLGLAISRRLARALGGDLRLVTDNANGACFVLTLPLARMPGQ
jgi:signal transduction histidine kinase